jgi:hypothetical protein
MQSETFGSGFTAYFHHRARVVVPGQPYVFAAPGGGGETVLHNVVRKTSGLSHVARSQLFAGGILSLVLFSVSAGAASAISISCPGPIIVNNAPGQCGATVQFASPSVSGNVGPYTLTCTRTSGSFFPVGTTVVQCTARDAAGTATCSFSVTVRDVEPPVISGVSASPNVLWPPNHKFVDVRINYNVRDNCGIRSCVLSVSSNEAVNARGSGNTAPDWIVVDANRVRLRAERAGPGNGRIYTVTITCTDVNGNVSRAAVTVSVPHDQGKKK